MLFTHIGVPCFLAKEPFGHLIKFQHPLPSPFLYFPPFSGLFLHPSIHPTIYPSTCSSNTIQEVPSVPVVGHSLRFQAPSLLFSTLHTHSLPFLSYHPFFPGKPLSRRQFGLQVSGQEREGQAPKLTPGHVDDVLSVLYVPFTL